MKKYINNKQYNTETAKPVGRWDNGYPWNDFNHCREELFKKKTGEYFLYGQGGAFTAYRDYDGDMTCSGEDITPFSYKQARQWAEEHLTSDEYESEFVKIEKKQKITVDLLPEQNAKLIKYCRENNVSLSDAIRRLIERA